MKVKVADKPGTGTTPVGEMSAFGSAELGIISEMVSEPTKLADFGFDQRVIARASALKDAHPDLTTPEFPVVRVEEGWSNNGRLWDGEELDSIAEQVTRLEPVGHLGHIEDAKAGTEMPDPQTTWLGALTKLEPSQQDGRKGEMVKAIYLAGWNIPGAKIQGYIRSKAVRGISWWGRARSVPVPGKGVQVKGFKVESIDWARKLGEGMPTTSIVGIASEQNEGGHMDKDLAAVTPEEYEKECPNGYKLIVTQVGAEKDAKIGEMTAKVEAAEADQKLLSDIRAQLKLGEGENVLDKLVELMSTVGAKAKEKVDAIFADKLKELIPDEDKRAVVARMMQPQVAEMITKAEGASDTEAVEKIVSEMTDKAVNDDELISQFVSEQTAPVVRRRQEIGAGAGTDTDKAITHSGATRERQTV